ncbi:hypothetical protein IFM89_030132 [Coptis chinensis]|uniref:Cellulose synthase-like protein E1 n=1 Tax=Coptis chinensis TaxID=261450 RepID=A0A835I7D7_9MAGN|nr:hypothetical protein IFM89_030132 [Coptis chinensis]
MFVSEKERKKEREMGSGSEGEGYLPLFETKEGKGKNAYRLFSISMFLGISMIWVYRITHVPVKIEERWVWIFMFLAELWFGLYWVLTQSVRWNRVYRYTFRDRLSHRYEDKLPGVDIFVCTADPTIEPPMMVINTVLSVMAYNYPTEKLSVYVSDDGGSDLTFYALLEAAQFAKHWIPFSKKFNIEPRSPAAYFSTKSDPPVDNKVLSSIKKLYESMEHQIETASKLGRIPEDSRIKHKGFSEWDSVSSPRDHQTILQVLIDRRNPSAIDIDGVPLPTLVYLAREKRPSHPHNFKAGAMNALIRVSSKISNGTIILNVDCDMYSNNSESVRDALCFFMDEKQGHEIAFVQYPQCFNNLTNNDTYGGSLIVGMKMEFPGLDGFGGPLYIGTGCFHRRETLCGRKYSKEYKVEFVKSIDNRVQESINELEEQTKILADCTSEKGTEWGKEMGLKYGCPVEDVITGLAIQCRGWKSVYFYPTRTGFFGIAPITLAQTLVQHKRWSEAFEITAKVSDQDVSQRYEKDIFEFGNSSPMFTILATLALLNLFSLAGGLNRIIKTRDINDLQSMFLQILLTGLIVILNQPLYRGLFFRKDNGRMPTSVTVKSIVLSLTKLQFLSELLPYKRTTVISRSVQPK